MRERREAGRVVFQFSVPVFGATSWPSGPTWFACEQGMGGVNYPGRPGTRADPHAPGAAGPGTAPGAGARSSSAGGVIAARTPGLRGGAAPGVGRARCWATKGDGLPDVEADFGSGGGAAAAKCVTGQANTPQRTPRCATQSRRARPGGNENMPFDFPIHRGGARWFCAVGAAGGMVVLGTGQLNRADQAGPKFGFLFSITAASASLASGVDLMMEVA